MLTRIAWRAQLQWRQQCRHLWPDILTAHNYVSHMNGEGFLGWMEFPLFWIRVGRLWGRVVITMTAILIPVAGYIHRSELCLVYEWVGVYRVDGASGEPECDLEDCRAIDSFEGEKGFSYQRINLMFRSIRIFTAIPQFIPQFIDLTIICPFNKITYEIHLALSLG
jgi:hypothetical protein